MLQIDHFTLGASDLLQGRADFQELTGLTLPMGGKHPHMSTHNCLTSVGHRQFFELIAIDKQAPHPGRTRWFSLDEARTRSRLSKRPRALCWVVETNDIETLVANSPVDLGDIITLTRDGRSWRLTVPKEGHLPEQGLLPAFIEWSPGPHPSTVQDDIGLRLEEIILHHPDPKWLTDVMTRLGVAHLARIETGEKSLAFQVITPGGRLILD